MSAPIPAVNVPLNKVGEMRPWVCVCGRGPGGARPDGVWMCGGQHMRQAALCSRPPVSRAGISGVPETLSACTQRGGDGLSTRLSEAAGMYSRCCVRTNLSVHLILAKRPRGDSNLSVEQRVFPDTGGGGAGQWLKGCQGPQRRQAPGPPLLATLPAGGVTSDEKEKEAAQSSSAALFTQQRPTPRGPLMASWLSSQKRSWRPIPAASSEETRGAESVAGLGLGACASY